MLWFTIGITKQFSKMPSPPHQLLHNWLTGAHLLHIRKIKEHIASVSGLWLTPPSLGVWGVLVGGG